MTPTISSSQRFSSRSLEYLPSPKLKDLNDKNDECSLSKTLRMRIITDIDSCYKLWKKFSPEKTLFDTWEFRLAFHKAYQYKPYFLLLKNQSRELAFLPLWYEDEKKKYFWFGSDWQEEVGFFSTDPNYVPLLLFLAPSPLLLNAISQDSVGSLKGKIEFEEDEPKYVLNIQGFRSHEDYLMTLKKKRRLNLRRARRRIERQNPRIVINNFSHFEHLVRLSKERFEQKSEKTDWEDPRKIEAFRQVIKLAGKSYKIRMISIMIGNEIAGVDLIALFNRCYYTLICGYNIRDFSGIGNFLNLLEIDDAIRLGMRKIDFLQDSYEWKNNFFDEIPLFKYEK